jgi:hypothetical protein
MRLLAETAAGNVYELLNNILNVLTMHAGALKR